MALSHYWVNDNLTLHPTLLEDRSPLFRDQEICGDDVADIDDGEQRDCEIGFTLSPYDGSNYGDALNGVLDVQDFLRSRPLKPFRFQYGR